MPGRCLLVIEDHLHMRERIGELLAVAFPERAVVMAASAEEGLSLAAAHGVVAAVVDVNLPGINGFEATRRLRRAYEGIDIVLVSMNVSALTRREALDAGALAMLSKTDAVHDLVPLLQDALSRKASIKDS